MSDDETAQRAQTVGEYAEMWLAGYEQRVKRSTYDRACVAVRRIAAHELATAAIDAVPLSTADDFSTAHPASIQTG